MSHAAYESSPPSKASLLRWWKAFTAKSSSSASSGGGGQVTRGRAQTAPAYQPPGRGLAKGKSGVGRVFGVSPEQSLKYAAVAISTAGPDGKPYVYGYVPIVVAKCGMMLKESATATEGIFRVSGSNKRINQLQAIFDEPPRYGKDLDWTGYTVHDAASVLRRYLNMMPEPVIPAHLYVDFVHVLQRGLPEDACVAEYQRLISLLPPTSRYLLLYLLDFLSVFVRSSQLNLMTASNLAVVFQPGLVSTRREGTGEGALLGFPGFVDGRIPTSSTGAGAQAREGAGEHGRGKEVLEFLIEQQSKFMVGLEAPSSSAGAPVVVGGPRTSSKAKAAGEIDAPGLVRRGSEKSVERRRLRKAADGSNAKVKRSRTLPGRGSSMPGGTSPTIAPGGAEMKKTTSSGASSQGSPRPHKAPPLLSPSPTSPATTTTTTTTTSKTRSTPPILPVTTMAAAPTEERMSVDTMYTAKSGTDSMDLAGTIASSDQQQHPPQPLPRWIPTHSSSPGAGVGSSPRLQ